MDKILGTKVLLEVDDILKTLDVEYWLMHGTCLGAFRDNDIIEDDKDLDLGMRIENFIAISDILRNQLLENGFIVEEHKYPCSYTRTMFITKHGVLLEIMGHFLLDNKMIAFTQQKHNGCYVHQSKFFTSLKKISFLDREFNIPDYTEEFLTETYGGDWQVPKIKTYDKCEKRGYFDGIREKFFEKYPE